MVKINRKFNPNMCMGCPTTTHAFKRKQIVNKI